MKNVLTWVLLMGLAGFAVQVRAQEVQPKEGYLFLPTYLGNKDGTVAPLRVLSAADGQEVKLRPTKAAFSPGNQFALDPGDYHIELGQLPSPVNRRSFVVESGKITVVEVGTVTVLFEIDVRKIDFCSTWSQNMTIYVKGPDGYVQVAADVSMDTVRHGAVQLHRGDYLLEWNKFHVPITVSRGKRLEVRPIRVAPFEGFTKPRLEEAPIDGLDKPGANSPCTDKPVFLFPGDYSLSHRVKTNTYPFHTTASQTTSIARKSDFLRYRKLPGLKGSGRLYKGKRGTGERVPTPQPSTDQQDDPTARPSSQE